MGRFDALTQLEKKPLPPLPAPSVEKPRKPESQQVVNPENPKTGIPAFSKAGKPENPNAQNAAHTKVEKYTTQLEPELIKQIKQNALENDIKDYEVVQRAVKAYLAKK